MEQTDPQMEQRVWQRVHGGAAPLQLPLLIGWLLGCAEGCAALSRHFRGQEARLSQMRSELLRQAACLRGIHLLRTGEPITAPIPSPGRETTDALLRRCIGQCLRLQQNLRSQTSDAEYGPVFEQMAMQTAGHIHLLLELAGK